MASTDMRGTEMALLIHERQTKDDRDAIRALSSFNGSVAIISLPDGKQQILPSLRVDHVYFRGLGEILSYVAVAKKSGQPAESI